MNTTVAPSVVDVNVADPIVTPAVTTIGVGKTLHFTNHSQTFSAIEIHFGTSPDGTDTVFTGTQSVDVPVNVLGSFQYTIRHVDANGSQTSGPFAVHSCRGC
jgi:hypothetical protein